MKVCAVNWRDIRNPDAGGAEVHLHEILAHLVRWGHEATQISSGWPGCVPEEEIDGIRILRRGRWYNANIVLQRFTGKHVRSNPYDVVLEDINKLPFFLPLVTSVPVVGVIPHLFGTAAFRETNPVIASSVWLLEQFIPFVFRKNHFMVISPSTMDDLVSRGIRRDRIEVVLCGLDHSKYRNLGYERFERPTIVHLGRLRRYKSVDVAIRAMAHIREQLPSARLVIIGDGPQRAALVKETKSLGLEDAVEFAGFMELDELVEFLNRSHLLVNPSPKEGWGLTVVEANACGVPVVASDRPGLRDSVWDGKSGYLVPYGDDRAFAEKSLLLLDDEDNWRRMSAQALERVKELTWERCARETEAFLEKLLGSKERKG
jgi:glycosyltransferase involved in cell wall biosynthesis